MKSISFKSLSLFSSPKCSSPEHYSAEELQNYLSRNPCSVSNPRIATNARTQLDQMFTEHKKYLTTRCSCIIAEVETFQITRGIYFGERRVATYSKQFRWTQPKLWQSRRAGSLSEARRQCLMPRKSVRDAVGGSYPTREHSQLAVVVHQQGISGLVQPEAAITGPYGTRSQRLHRVKLVGVSCENRHFKAAWAMVLLLLPRVRRQGVCAVPSWENWGAHTLMRWSTPSSPPRLKRCRTLCLSRSHWWGQDQVSPSAGTCNLCCHSRL